MRATPGRERDLSHTQRLALPRQRGSEIDVPRSGLGAPAELGQYFRTYFIALAANTYTTMHYDISCQHEPESLYELHAARQDAARGYARNGPGHA